VNAPHGPDTRIDTGNTMPADASDKRFANTLARGLTILRAFRPTDDGLGNLEISERTGIPRPTVSRLTFTLCALGYLTHGRRHDKYRLGPAALALGNIAAASFAFVEIASPVMQQLADATGTLTAISIKDDQRMLLTRAWRPVNSSAIWLDVGYRMPLHTSSSGKAYLGALNDEEFARFLESHGDEPEELLAEFAAIRLAAHDEILADGYTQVRGGSRFSETINAAAVPYRPSDLGEPVAFLASSTSKQLTDQRISDEVGPALAEAVSKVRRMTGQQSALVMNE